MINSGWNPGNNRTLPPLSHAEFAGKIKMSGSRKAPQIPD